MLPLNPYTAGNPIKDQSGFFGRQDVFKKVMDVLRQPSSNGIVLYGQRRIGKTTVLLQLNRQLAENEQFTPVYFDLHDKSAKSLDVVLFELAEFVADATDQPDPNSAKFDQEGNFFRQTFLPNAASHAKGDGLVLLFDEFDVLDNPDGDRAGLDFFPYLRAWMADVERVQFVFVIGRRPEDLSPDTLATFKAVQAMRVSLLDQKDTESIVRQSETDNSLLWTDRAVEQVWNWTHGHPFLTQQLCSVIWDDAVDEISNDTHQIRPEHVDEAINEALHMGSHAFQWIWDGLPPAERVVTAAMAEASEDVISQKEIVEILRSSGVRLIVRELELAPETLVKWEVLEQVEDGYRFMVPLLRHWVEKNRPLRRVKEELDRLDPIAEDHYQLGQTYYQREDSEQAEFQLRQALKINPNHLKSGLLLGRILLETGRTQESVDVYEAAYQYDRDSTRANLIRALLALAEEQDEGEQFNIYERILTIDPTQTIAIERSNSIWVKRGDQALKDEKWLAAVEIYDTLLQRVPEEKEFQTRLEIASNQAWLKQRYNEALGALETGDAQSAQRLFADVINRQPDYQEASRYLLKAIEEIDVRELQEKLISEEKGRQEAERRCEDYQTSIESLENELAGLYDKVEPEPGPEVDEVSDEETSTYAEMEDIPEEVDTEWVWWIGIPLAVLAFAVVSTFFVFYYNGSSVEAGLAVLIVISIAIFISVGLDGDWGIGCVVGIVGGVIGGLIVGYIAYRITGYSSTEFQAGSLTSIAVGAVSGILAFGLVLGATYGVERLTNSALNLRARRALERCRQQFIDAIAQQGFEKSPRSERLFYNQDLPDVRFRLGKITATFEKRRKDNKRWYKWETYSIVNETDLALKVIDHPDRLYKSDD